MSKIEKHGDKYLVHTGGIYGYYWFDTLEEAGKFLADHYTTRKIRR